MNSSGFKDGIAKFVVGSAYVTIGVIGILANFLCFYVLLVTKDLRSPTYFYIKNICISDSICLLAIGLFMGMAEIILGLQKYNICLRFALFFLQLGWYTSGYFSVMITATRFIALKSPNLNVTLEQKPGYLYGSAVMVWVTVLILAMVINFVHPALIGYVDESNFTFGIDHHVAYAHIISKFNVIHDCLICIFTIVINFASLNRVRKMMNEVGSSSHEQNRRLEIKLFFQCLITTTLLVIICGIIVVCVSLKYEMTVVQCIIFHTLWIFYHTVCPFVYFIVNGKLRKNVLEIFHFKFCGK